MLPNASALPKPTPRSITRGRLPAFVDETQPPQKRQPFGSLFRQQGVYSLDLIVPNALADAVKKRLDDSSSVKVKYAKVMMSLGEVLSGDFFTRYVKTGNVIMISEGRRGLDTRFEMFNGSLRIEVDKATYERAGLVGTAIPDGGMKHSKNRYAIEIDLRLPSMLHGKKGFERIKWACRNVFDQSLTWLFHDLAPHISNSTVDPIEKHQPRFFTLKPIFSQFAKVRVPNLTNSASATSLDAVSDDGILASDLEEWISLVALKSPRVQAGDKPNAFICRYHFPTEEVVVDKAELDRVTTVMDLTQVTWHGFIPSSFVLHILVLAKRASKSGGWWIIRSQGLRRDNDILTILQRDKQNDESPEFLCWHNSK